jgi:hypothetical protein
VIERKQKKSILCRCERGIFRVSQVGVVVDDPTMITLETCFFADCVNCGAQWFVDPSLKGGNLMLATSQAAKDRVSELRAAQWDAQFVGGEAPCQKD